MLPQSRGEFKPHRAAAHSVPIYVPGRDKPIGHVSGGAFRKTVRSSLHFLHRPPAIAFDMSTLRDAQGAGATRAVVTDADTGRVYGAPLELVLACGFSVKRGHGAQWALGLAYWSVNGAPSEMEAREAAQAAQNSQLSLFELGAA